MNSRSQSRPRVLRRHSDTLNQQHDASYWQLHLTKYHTMRNAQHRLTSCLIWAALKTFLLGVSWLRRNTTVWLSASQNILSLLTYFMVHRQHRSQCKTTVPTGNHGVGNTTENSKVFSLIQISQLVPAINMPAVKLCFNEILQFLTVGASQHGLTSIMATQRFRLFTYLLTYNRILTPLHIPANYND